MVGVVLGLVDAEELAERGERFCGHGGDQRESHGERMACGMSCVVRQIFWFVLPLWNSICSLHTKFNIKA